MRRLSITLGSLAILLGSAQPSQAQFISPQKHEGAHLSIDSSTGSRCSSRGADRANVALIGSATNDDNRVTGLITIPFGGRDQGNCSTLVKHEEARSRLELAAQLFEAGAITPKQFEAIAADVAKLVL